MSRKRNDRRWQGRKTWSAVVAVALISGGILGVQSTALSNSSKVEALLAEHERFPGEVLVKLSPEGLRASNMGILNGALSLQGFNLTSLQTFETNSAYLHLKLADDKQTAELIETLSQNPSVEYAEPNYVIRALGMRDEDESIPNDAEFSKLWGMKNIGQADDSGAIGIAGADIKATKAWKLNTDARNILVAVIDTGVDYNHPDLKDNIYANPGESGEGRETNGIDDDGNGFVDDVRGWNFAGVSTNNPMDDNEHGTHCAGTIGAKGNDGAGVAGVTWNTTILPIKFLTASGSGSLADAVKSIQYASKMGAKVISNSWGGGGFSQAMFDAIKEANDKGLLFIAAAGNSAQNSDSTPHFPAGYQLPNVIAVGATDNKDRLATFSTYGKRTVHIAAPGHKIFSTIPGGRYATFSGTSMACPHVSGAAALVWGANPGLSFGEIKDRLLKSRDYVPGISRKISSGGRLNVYNALAGIYPPSPEPSETDWRDLALESPIESAHPYTNNFSQEWTVQAPAGVKFMRVVFSQVDLESGYDFVRILDGNNVEVDSVSGKSTGNSSYYAAGNKVVIRFTSDSSQVRWGFAVEKIQVIY